MGYAWQMIALIMQTDSVILFEITGTIGVTMYLGEVLFHINGQRCGDYRVNHVPPGITVCFMLDTSSI